MAKLMLSDGHEISVKETKAQIDSTLSSLPFKLTVTRTDRIATGEPTTLMTAWLVYVTA